MISNAQNLLEQKFDFKVTQLPLEEALSQLSNITEIPISYSNSILPTDRIVSINLQDKTLRYILNQMLRKTSVRFKQVGSQVVLFYRKRKKQKYKISGFIEDKESGERLVGANIYESLSGKGASTNEYGFYSLTLTEGEINLACSYLGYETKIQTLEFEENIKVNFLLDANLTIREIIVIGNEFANPLDALPPLGGVDIPVQQMSLYPSLGGESDVFRMVTLMPGVQTGADGLGGLHIRGGNTDQNLVLMDGVPLYNAAHSLGIFSVFNPEAVKSMKLYKGGFDARYTGRLSSVMDVRTKEGNMKKWAGSVNAGMATMSASLEGPLVKDKVSVFFTARRSILDRAIRKATAKIKEENTIIDSLFGVPLIGFSSYNFYDVNGKINIALSEKDNIYLSYYKGRDDFYDQDELRSVQQSDFTFSDELKRDFSWGNELLVLRWNHLFNNKLFLNTTLTKSNYQFNLFENYVFKYTPRDINVGFRQFTFNRVYLSSLNDWGAKVDFDYASSKNHHLRFGASSTLHRFRPGIYSAEQAFQNILILDSLLNNPFQEMWEHTLYLEDEFFIGKKLKINVGGNLMAVNAGASNNDFTPNDTTYFSFQPRLSFSFLASDNLVLQASAGKITQSLHLLTGTDIGLPNDLWVPSTSLVEPEYSWQGSVGMNLQIKKQYQFGAEFYYKKLENLLAFQAGSSFNSDIANPSQWSLSSLDATNWELEVDRGRGTSYGAEFQLQKTLGSTTGIISYTYSNTTRNFEQVNDNSTQRYRFDRRHDLKLAFNHRIFKWLDFSWNWIYGTGLATLLPVREYIIETPTGPETLFDFEHFELTPNHRLDAGFNCFLEKKGLQHQWYLGVYNAYNRRNPQYYTLQSYPVKDFDPTNPKYDRQLIEGSVFPILPSISYSLRF